MIVLLLLLLLLLLLISVPFLKYFSYDKLDRYCIRQLVYKLSTLAKRSAGQGHGQIILRILFGSPEQLAILSEGSIYNGLYIEDITKYDDKLFWTRIFEKYKIRYPQTYTTCVDGKVSTHNPALFPVLFKPLHDGLGNGIKVIHSLPSCKEGDNWLTQTFLRDCDYPHARHYRVITLLGSVYCIYQYNGAEGKIASNHAKGGRVKLMYWNGTTLEKGCPPSLRDKMAHDLARVHRSELPHIFSIGWDVLINCEGENKVPYALEGNLLHGVWADMDDAKEATPIKFDMMRDYRQKALAFHQKMGYIQ